MPISAKSHPSIATTIGDYQFQINNQIMNTTEEKKNGGSNGANGKEVTIILNGRKVSVPKEELSYSELVELSQTPTGENVTHTITYRNGHGNKPIGSLVEGESVKVKDGMIFNVTPTDRS